MSDPKSKVLDTIGAVSGLGRTAVASIVAEVRANRAKLDSCHRHEFIGLPDGAIKCKNGFLYRKYRCANCGGTVDSYAEYWYRLGMEHWKGDAK